jgi:hypothetical protein
MSRLRTARARRVASTTGRDATVAPRDQLSVVVDKGGMQRLDSDGFGGVRCCTSLLYDALDPQDGGLGVMAADG